jgi:hypothetical protein
MGGQRPNHHHLARQGQGVGSVLIDQELIGDCHPFRDEATIRGIAQRVALRLSAEVGVFGVVMTPRISRIVAENGAKEIRDSPLGPVVEPPLIEPRITTL